MKQILFLTFLFLYIKIEGMDEKRPDTITLISQYPGEIESQLPGVPRNILEECLHLNAYLNWFSRGPFYLKLPSTVSLEQFKFFQQWLNNEIPKQFSFDQLILLATTAKHLQYKEGMILFHDASIKLSNYLLQADTIECFIRTGTVNFDVNKIPYELLILILSKYRNHQRPLLPHIMLDPVNLSPDICIIEPSGPNQIRLKKWYLDACNIHLPNTSNNVYSLPQGISLNDFIKLLTSLALPIVKIEEYFKSLDTRQLAHVVSAGETLNVNIKETLTDLAGPIIARQLHQPFLEYLHLGKKLSKGIHRNVIKKIILSCPVLYQEYFQAMLGDDSSNDMIIFKNSTTQCALPRSLVKLLNQNNRLKQMLSFFNHDINKIDNIEIQEDTAANLKIFISALSYIITDHTNPLLSLNTSKLISIATIADYFGFPSDESIIKKVGEIIASRLSTKQMLQEGCWKIRHSTNKIVPNRLYKEIKEIIDPKIKSMLEKIKSDLLKSETLEQFMKSGQARVQTQEGVIDCDTISSELSKEIGDAIYLDMCHTDEMHIYGRPEGICNKGIQHSLLLYYCVSQFPVATSSSLTKPEKKPLQLKYHTIKLYDSWPIKLKEHIESKLEIQRPLPLGRQGYPLAVAIRLATSSAMRNSSTNPSYTELLQKFTRQTQQKAICHQLAH